MHTIDIRQSDFWSDYLRLYNWTSIKTSNNSILRINDYLFTKRASVQMPHPLKSNDLIEIESICRSNKVLFIKVSPNFAQDIEVLKAHNYKKTTKIELAPNTMTIDLTTGFTTIWENFSSNCRYSIHKSERDGCYTKIIKNPSYLDILNFYKLLTSIGRAKHFVIPSLQDILKKVEVFGDESFLCNIYNKDAELLGSKFFLGFDNAVWGLHSATTTLGQKSTGGYKLLSDCLKYFCENNYKQMDLGGIYDNRLKELTNNWRGYSHFKQEFNGKVTYFSLPYVKWFW